MVDRLRFLVAGLVGRLEDLKREEGQTTPEWAIVVALVIALAVAAFAVLGPVMSNVMTQIGNAIINALP
jgi:Flp pilus assembly pilin Flp